MFATRLKDLRIEKNITQESLGAKLNFGHSTICQYESGKRKPDIETLEKLADYFGVSLDYLVGRSDIPNPYNKADPDNEFINRRKELLSERERGIIRTFRKLSSDAKDIIERTLNIKKEDVPDEAEANLGK